MLRCLRGQNFPTKLGEMRMLWKIASTEILQHTGECLNKTVCHSIGAYLNTTMYIKCILFSVL